MHKVIHAENSTDTGSIAQRSPVRRPVGHMLGAVMAVDRDQV
jgi:hypothetical protein